MPHDDRGLPWAQRALIGGFKALSTTDWPGRPAATVFVRGCPWRCAYCHNPHLQPRSREGALAWPDVAARIESAGTAIEAVVFSGGEPTSDRTLPDQMHWVRDRGLAVGLHTNGAYPDRLPGLLPLVDWVGFDLKTEYDAYDELTRAPGSADRVTRSARIVVRSGVAHEFRLTWHSGLVGSAAARTVAHFARELGAQAFVIQHYDPLGTGACGPAASPPPDPRLLDEFDRLFPRFEYRHEKCGLDEGCHLTPAA